MKCGNLNALTHMGTSPHLITFSVFLPEYITSPSFSKRSGRDRIHSFKCVYWGLI